MIGKQLKELREQRHLTQLELAQSLRITRSALSLYELDKRDPDTTLLTQIADFFNVSTDYLLGRNKTSENKAKVSPSFEDIELLNDESKKDLKKYIELLKIKDMKEKNEKDKQSGRSRSSE